MNKLTVMAITAIAAAGLTPITAQAADFTISKGVSGYIIVGQGNHMGDLQSKLQELGIRPSQIDWNNCERIQIPDFGQQKPEFPDFIPPQIPEIPDNNLPQLPDTETPGGDQSSLAFTEQVVRLVNQERSKAGIAPLTVNRNAEEAAAKRSKELETSFSHTRPDGSSFSTALTQQGVSFSGAGENIAWGQKTPEEVMESWMNSAGHRANILNSSYTSIGVGNYQNASGTNYWTQLFIK